MVTLHSVLFSPLLRLTLFHFLLLVRSVDTRTTTLLRWSPLSAGMVPELCGTLVEIYISSQQLRLRYLLSMNDSVEMLYRGPQ